MQEHAEKAEAHIKETGDVMNKLDSDTVDELKMIAVDFKSVMEWKEEQAGIDLADIRRSQDSIKEALDTVQRDLFEKIAREEVDSKLESKVRRDLRRGLLRGHRSNISLVAVREHHRPPSVRLEQHGER